MFVEQRGPGVAGDENHRRGGDSSWAFGRIFASYCAGDKNTGAGLEEGAVGCSGESGRGRRAGGLARVVKGEVGEVPGF